MKLKVGWCRYHRSDVMLRVSAISTQQGQGQRKNIASSFDFANDARSSRDAAWYFYVYRVLYSTLPLRTANSHTTVPITRMKDCRWFRLWQLCGRKSHNNSLDLSIWVRFFFFFKGDFNIVWEWRYFSFVEIQTSSKILDILFFFFVYHRFEKRAGRTIFSLAFYWTLNVEELNGKSFKKSEFRSIRWNSFNKKEILQQVLREVVVKKKFHFVEHKDGRHKGCIYFFYPLRDVESCLEKTYPRMRMWRSLGLKMWSSESLHDLFSFFAKLRQFKLSTIFSPLSNSVIE